MPTPLILKIEVDDRGKINVDKVKDSFDRLKDVTEKADKKTKAFSHTMGTVKGVLGGVTKAVFSLKGALAALGLGMLAKSAISVASRFEQVQVALDTITKGKGVETFKALNLWALRMPVNTEKAIESFQMMIAMGLQPSIKDMTILVDTMAALGGSEDIITSIALALGKIQAKSGATARELLMLTRRGIPAVQILREELNDTSIGFENIATSSYNANQLITAILSGLEKRYGGLSKKIQNIWFGLFETVKSEYKEFMRVIFASGVMEYLESKLKNLIDQIDIWRASGQLDVWAKNVADALITAFKKIEAGIRYVINHWRDWLDIFKSLLPLVKIFIAFKLGAILTEIGAGAIFAIKQLVNMKTILTAINLKLKALSVGTKGGLLAMALFGGWEVGKWLNEKFDIVKEWGIALAAGLHKTFLWLEKSLKGTWDLIKFAFDKMIQGIEITLNSLPKSIQFVLNSIIDGINKLLDSMSKLPIIGEKIQGAKLGKIEFGTIKLKEDYMTFEKVLQNLLKYESDYEKAIKDAKKIWQEMFDEVGEVDDKVGSINKKVKETTKTTDIELPQSIVETTSEITKMGEIWDETWKKIDNDFVDGFANMLSGNIRKFSDFMKNLKDIFLQGLAKMFSEALIRPLIEPLTAGLKSALSGGIGQLVGGGIGGKAGKGLLGDIAGIGARNLLMGAGAIFSISKLFGKDKFEPARIELEWEINAEKFEQVLDVWEGSATKNTQFLNSMNENIGKMHSLYQTIADFSNTTLKDFTITLDALTANALSLKQVGFEFAQANIELLERLFGAEMIPTEAITEIERLEAERKRLIEAGPWVTFGGSLGSIGQFQEALDEINSQIESILDNFNLQMGELYEGFFDFADEYSKIIGTAFIDSLETRQFSDFKKGLRQGIYGSFKSALLAEFTTTALHDVMSTIWESFGLEGWSDIVKDVMAGNTTQALAMIETMTDAVDQIEPVFDLLTDMMTQMENALGLNTEAIISNNSLLEKQQEIEGFISQLTTGQLAPVQSYETIMGRYQELLASDNLSELFNFVTGTALPFLQTYGGNYQEAFSGIIEDLRNLSGLYGANISPSAIGEAVAGAIMPALQGGTQTIHVTIEVDGREIGEVLLDQLQTNPQLIQEVKEITQ